MKKAILSTAIMGLTMFSCKVKTEVNPDNASAIAGTYVMSSYVTQAGASTGVSDNHLVIAKVNDNTVKVTIDYADPSTSDVVSNSVAITKSGSDYNLSQTFSNATASGKVTGNTATFKIAYTNGNFVNIVASK